MSDGRDTRRFARRLGAVIGALGILVAALPARAAGWSPPPPTYQAGDYAGGQAMSILPAGENGLVNAAQVLQYESSGARPAASQDQLGPYEALAYAASLSDAELSRYFDDESFGIPAGQVTATEFPDPSLPVVIYRDAHDVPHIYAANDDALALGAGYAAAQDRLFLMDVLRHYSEGTLSAFLGPSCQFEQMDHDQLLAAAYTEDQAQQQLDALPREYGRLGTEVVSMIDSYVAGINRYIAASRTDPRLLPADYGAALEPPLPWTPTDVVHLVSLIGSVATGGGDATTNAALVQYLTQRLGSSASAAESVFSDLKEQNDPAAPTSISSPFPYLASQAVNPQTVAMPDDAARPLVGGPTDTTPGCSLSAPDPTAVGILSALANLAGGHSNALVVPASHSADGHPIAVFGPELGYYAPQVLMEEDLHSPDVSAEGAAFPGANFVVELGRGPDFAWSATTASSEQIVQRLELVCNPSGGPVSPTGAYYLFDGRCLPMAEHTFSEAAVPKPGGVGAPTVITHRIYETVHGIVRGWTTADGGRPVAVVDQRSTFMHEPDSFVGFVRWNTPSLTTGPRSWLAGVADVAYGFNWIYVDDRNIAYGVSGRDFAFPTDVNPNLPIWGDGVAGFGLLPAADHPHAINPAQPYLTSWNNKPAPGFSASDDMYGWGPVQRVQLLDQNLDRALAADGGKLTRAEVVEAMENAALADLDGRTVLPALLGYLGSTHEAPGVAALLAQLRSWLDAGALRSTGSPTATQYEHAAAVAIMDQLETNLIEALFNPLLAAGGITSADGLTSYTKVPMPFVDAPHNADGVHQGDGYYVGWEGYVVKALSQLEGHAVAQPFSSALMGQLCGPGGCMAAVQEALSQTYQQLVSANGTTNVAGWTADQASAAAGQTLPEYDDIQFSAIGIVGQPAIAWQNRPTFQQVVEFPSHRPGASA